MSAFLSNNLTQQHLLLASCSKQWHNNDCQFIDWTSLSLRLLESFLAAPALTRQSNLLSLCANQRLRICIFRLTNGIGRLLLFEGSRWRFICAGLIDCLNKSTRREEKKKFARSGNVVSMLCRPPKRRIFSFLDFLNMGKISMPEALMVNNCLFGKQTNMPLWASSKQPH